MCRLRERTKNVTVAGIIVRDNIIRIVLNNVLEPAPQSHSCQSKFTLTVIIITVSAHSSTKIIQPGPHQA